MQALQQRDPDLSVIIPVYNLERFLAPMLDTLKAQKLGDYQVEIIFVLNNCTDHSEDVIRASGLDCQIISCSIQGCGPARNAAMDIARGRWIWFMDGDDWLMADTSIKDALDLCTAENLELLRIPYASNRFDYQYFSMVWQYVMRRDYIDEFRFPAIQPIPAQVGLQHAVGPGIFLSAGNQHIQGSFPGAHSYISNGCPRK